MTKHYTQLKQRRQLSYPDHWLVYSIHNCLFIIPFSLHKVQPQNQRTKSQNTLYIQRIEMCFFCHFSLKAHQQHYFKTKFNWFSGWVAAVYMVIKALVYTQYICVIYWMTAKGY